MPKTSRPSGGDARQERERDPAREPAARPRGSRSWPRAPRLGAVTLRLLSLRGLNAWPAGSARPSTVLPFRARCPWRVTQSHASPTSASIRSARVDDQSVHDTSPLTEASPPHPHAGNKSPQMRTDPVRGSAWTTQSAASVASAWKGRSRLRLGDARPDDQQAPSSGSLLLDECRTLRLPTRRRARPVT